jgi:hypothetical protein
LPNWRFHRDKFIIRGLRKQKTEQRVFLSPLIWLLVEALDQNTEWQKNGAGNPYFMERAFLLYI